LWLWSLAVAACSSSKPDTYAAASADDLGGSASARGPASPGQSAAALGPAGFSATGSMTTSAWPANATLLSDGRVLIAGGWAGNNTFLSSAELYDPKTGKFSPTGSMTTPRMGRLRLLADGQVLFTGAQSARRNCMTQDRQRFVLRLHVPCCDPMRPRPCSPDGRVLIAGGNTGSARRANTAEIYIQRPGVFNRQEGFDDPPARYGHTAPCCWTGRVLIAGGGDDQGSAEAIQPQSGTSARRAHATSSRMA